MYLTPAWRRPRVKCVFCGSSHRIFFSFPFQMKPVTFADKTPASLVSTPPPRNLLLSPCTLLLFAQLLALPLVFLTLLLRLRSLLFLLLLQLKRTLRTSLRLIPIFQLLSSMTPLLQPRLSFLVIRPERRFNLQNHSNCGPCEGIPPKDIESVPEHYRKVCFEEWRKTHGEASLEEFEIHWSNVTPAATKVWTSSLPTQSYPTLYHLN